jgi:hypothetical protein
MPPHGCVLLLVLLLLVLGKNAKQLAGCVLPLHVIGSSCGSFPDSLSSSNPAAARRPCLDRTPASEHLWHAAAQAKQRTQRRMQQQPAFPPERAQTRMPGAASHLLAHRI